MHAIVLDAEAVPYLDVTAAEALAQLDAELRAAGKRLLVARDIGQVRDVLDTDDDDALRQVYPSVRAAVAAARAHG